MFVPRRLIEEKLKLLLAEDVGQGDITASAIIPAGLTVNAVVMAKASGVVAGIEEATILAEYLGLIVQVKVEDGQEVENRKVLMQISGDAQTILSLERTMLNLLSRMSGIATTTKALVQLAKKKNPKILIAATRKSAPGLMYFDKKAVALGSGDPHRQHLDDMVLIKDNHIAIVGSAKKAVELAKANVSFTKKIEVEVTKVEDTLEVVKAGADIVMLDNFTPKMIIKAVELLKKYGVYGKVLLEASGGITSENLAEYAASGVDIISLGALTHSVQALDMSLEVLSVKKKEPKEV
jgi:nicotinate-nucleotide pyrophosphorylase (carboxylating)